MANIRPKDTDALSTLASNHEILVDGPDGFGTFLRDTFIAQVAALIVANPTTYKIATLDGADKLTSSQDPSQAVSYKGVHNASTNSPALADGSGTAGDTYQVNVAGTRDYGSGSLTLAVGDALVYSGSVWQQVSGVANILDGISTPSAAQTALEVISEDESAEIAGTKLVGPALSFDGVNDLITIAHDSKQHFNDGADDLPFSLSFWLKTDFSVAGGILGKYQSGSTEFVAWVTGNGLRFGLSDGTDEPYIQTASLTDYSNKWTHFAITSSGSGPNSANDFPAAIDSISVFVNGKDITSGATKQNEAAYGGLNNSSAAITLMSFAGSNFKKGEIRSVKLYNRELTAAEVAQLARGTDLGFADEWGDHTAGVYTGDSSTFTSTLGNWAEEGSTSITVAQSAGEMVITNTAASTGTRGANNTVDTLTEGKRYRLTFQCRASSGTGQSVQVKTFNSSPLSEATVTQGSATSTLATGIVAEFTPTVTNEQWSIEFVVSGGSTESLFFNLNNTGSGEVYNFDNITLTQIGTLADFRAENFIDGKLIDLSSNNFVGINNGATLVGGRKTLQLDTDGAAAGNNVLSVFNGSSSLASITDKGDLDANSISSGASSELTIAAGAVTATKSYHTIDTESDAASDDLDTISGGRAGQMLIVQANNSARSVVLKDGTGNLKLSGDITLDNAEDTATLVSDGTSWYLIATSNNGA